MFFGVKPLSEFKLVHLFTDRIGESGIDPKYDLYVKKHGDAQG